MWSHFVPALREPKSPGLEPISAQRANHKSRSRAPGELKNHGSEPLCSSARLRFPTLVYEKLSALLPCDEFNTFIRNVNEDCIWFSSDLRSRKLKKLSNLMNGKPKLDGEVRQTQNRFPRAFHPPPPVLLTRQTSHSGRRRKIFSAKDSSLDSDLVTLKLQRIVL